MTSRNSLDEPTLTETLPAHLISASWKTYIITVGTPVAVFCLAMSIGAGFHSGWQAALLISVLFWSFGAAIVFGTASVLDHNLRTQIPIVELWNDELVVRYGNRTLTAKVNDCHLHWGHTTSMRLLGGVQLQCWRRVILIDFPPFRNTLIGVRRPPRNVVAVGYSTQMRDKWERALLQCSANKRLNVSGGPRPT